MKKRLISFLMVISFIISVCPIVNAKVPSADFDEVIGLFEKIGLIEIVDGVEIDYTQKITRAEMAELWANFLELPNCEKMYYYDVPTDYWAFYKISALTERGILNGGAGKKFRPDDAVTLNEACIISIKTLGLEYMINATGKSYTTLASEKDLLKGLNTSEKELSKKDAYRLIYNTITAPTPEIESMSSKMISYREGDETLLSVYRDIYFNQGIVTGINKVNLYSQNYLSEGYISIDEVLYKYSTGSEYEWLGQKVRYYYHKDKDDDTSIIFLYKLEKNDVIEAEITEINSYNSNTGKLTYYTLQGKQKTANIAQNASLIYNGEFTKANIADVLNMDNYHIKLVEVDEAFDLIIVEKYYNMIAERVDTVNKIVYDKLNQSRNKCFDEDKYEKISFYTSDGLEASFSDINVGTVISVLESYSGEAVTVYISQNVINGKLDGMSQEGNMYVYEIDGSDIMAIEELKTYSGFSLGDNVQAYTDYKGYAVYILATRDVLFGYITKIHYSEEGLDDSVFVKVFDDRGTISTYTLYEKVKIDGMRYKEADLAYEALGGRRFKPCLAAFNTNADGKIISLDLAEKDYGQTKTSENMLIQLSDYTSLHYDNFQNKLGATVRVSSETILMGIPTKSLTIDNPKYYCIGNKNGLTNDEVYTGAAFAYGMNEKEFADIIILNDKILGSAAWISTRFVVDKITKTINDDEEVVDCIYGYHGNNYKQMYCIPEFSCEDLGITKGTVLDVGLVGENIATNTEILYRPKDSTSRPINKNLITLVRDTMFYVNDVVGTTIKAGFDSGANFDEVFSTGTAQILIYDSADDTLLPGTLAEIRTYKQYGDDCDSVYVYINSYEMRNFVVYR